MAKVLDQHLGTVRGKVGNTVFRMIGSKSFAGKAPKKYKKTKSELLIYNRKRFLVTSEFASAINDSKNLKELWKKSALVGKLPFHKICKENYQYARSGFLNTSARAFPDYHHLNSQPQAVMIGTYFDSFQLLDYYKYSCTGNFIEIQTQYRSQLLLLKRLPIISDRIWSENIFLRYANNNQLHNFIEAGYSMGNILGLANVGIFVAYENFRYRSTGIKLCLGIDRTR